MSARPPDERPHRAPHWSIAFDLGLRLTASVLIGIGAGLALDGWLHTVPLFTLLGVAVGIAAAGYTIWQVARDAMRRR